VLEPECSICQDRQYVREDLPPDHPRFGKLTPCSCQFDVVFERLKKLSRLSEEMQYWYLDQFIDREGKLGKVVTGLSMLLEERAGWATLTGPFGTGKTYLLAAFANEARLDQRRTVYTTTADLLADLRATFDPKSKESTSELFQQVLDAEVLCIDELEKFRATDWAMEQFFRLVEHRYRLQGEAITLWATNKRLTRDGTEVVMEVGDWEGYLESRMRDGRFEIYDQFWGLSDLRPKLRKG